MIIKILYKKKKLPPCKQHSNILPRLKPPLDPFTFLTQPILAFVKIFWFILARAANPQSFLKVIDCLIFPKAIYRNTLQKCM